jgi:His Kinase A (phospho-acceptor) domain/Histidine kinase-, DNA gyrase B-, and HSP90-like ATPase
MSVSSSVSAHPAPPSAGRCRIPRRAPVPAERFAAYAAHELRGPIALQRALVEVTLADGDASPARLREMGERVLASCRRQQELVDALLDLARSGSEAMRRERLDLAALATKALAAHDLGEFRGVVALERVWTTGDSRLLERLVWNLVANAIRHNVPRGRVELATYAQSGRAVLAVANTGRPIPTGALSSLFQPFRRLACNPPGAAEGTDSDSRWSKPSRPRTGARSSRAHRPAAAWRSGSPSPRRLRPQPSRCRGRAHRSHQPRGPGPPERAGPRALCAYA